MASRLACAAKTDVGLKRTNNEDNFAVIQSVGLFVLADGMGGHASGQVASTMCVSHVAQYICEVSRQPGFKFAFPTKPELSYEANLLANAIMYANERVFIQSCKDRSMEGMGTTVTAILNAPHGLVLAHVGDSRIYRVRKGEITQMTRDHSLLNHLIDKGEIKPEDAANFANKNVILRAIGLKDEVDVDVKEVPREKGDIYMMCSDGLSDLVSDPVIARTISEAPSLEDACASLIGLALKAGGKDNVTVVCVSVLDDDNTVSSPAQPRMSMQMQPVGMQSPQLNNLTMQQPVRQMSVSAMPAISNPSMKPVQMGQQPMQMQPQSMQMPMGMSMPQFNPGMNQSMVGMPIARQIVPNNLSTPPQPQRMHSVREIVETRPSQRPMPKPIGSAGRSNSTGMPAVTQAGIIKPAASQAGIIKPATSQDNIAKPKEQQDETFSVANPKECDSTAKQDKTALPETGLLFTTPPTAVSDSETTESAPIEEGSILFDDISNDRNFSSNDEDDLDDSNIRTMIECPILSEDVLGEHMPPQSLHIPLAHPTPASKETQNSLSPSPRQSVIYEDEDDDDSIIISKPASNIYTPPKDAIRPPKDIDDGDSIEISPDLYDDDEDSVTKTFTPTFKKW